MTSEKDILSLEMIRAYAPHLKVMGAYVQEPIPSVVGLDKFSVIASNDAASLYPTSIIYQNIGYDTIRDRIYDPGNVKPFLTLIFKVFESKRIDRSVIDSAIFGFKNALQNSLKDYFKRKSVPNKKEAEAFILEYYPLLLKRILNYNGELEDIFKPKTDEQYILLKSCLFPLLETISWLSPQNRGYNQTIVEYVFFHEDFIKKPREIYIFKNINSTKTTFEILSFEEAKKHFQTRILNPYGVLFDKHEDNLAFDVELLIESLAKRRLVKNRMLVLEAINEQFDSLSEEEQNFFKFPENGTYLSKEQANKILDSIQDPEEIREKRIKSLCEIEFNDIKDIRKFIKLRIAQLNIIQKGIKVAANSAYGIYGLITWLYASPLIGNAITSAGKIYGIKLFQAASVEILSDLKDKNNVAVI